MVLKINYSKSNKINQIRVIGTESQLTQRIKELKFNKISSVWSQTKEAQITFPDSLCPSLFPF